jgi:hypothetical protein
MVNQQADIKCGAAALDRRRSPAIQEPLRLLDHSMGLY